MNLTDPPIKRPYDPFLDGPEADAGIREEGRGAVALAVAVGVVVVFAATVWLIYRQDGSGTGGVFLETVIAGGTPERRAPLPSEAGSYVASGLDNPVLNLSEPTIPGQPSVGLAGAAPQAVPAAQLEPSAAPNPAPVKVGGTSQLAQTGTETTVTAPPPNAPSAIQVAEPEPPKTAALVVGGEFLVQVAAVKDEAQIESAWTQVKLKASNLLKDATMNVQRADVPNSGVFHRIRIDGFADRGAADAFCAELKALKQNCFVVKR
jgi:cell division septation protein DedD